MPQTVPQKLKKVTIRYWKFCIYGPPGVGKSILAGTSQKYRTLIFDVDEGVVSVKTFQNLNKLNDDLVDFWTIKSYQDFQDAWRYLCAHYKDYDLVVIDTVTELLGVVKREAMKANNHTTAEIRDWGTILDTMDNMFALFKSTPWHVIFLAHETEQTDPVTKTAFVRPSFRGSVKGEYARHISMIGRYMMWWEIVSKKNDKGQVVAEKILHRYITFGPNPNIHYKDRSGVMLQYEKPNIDNIIKKCIDSQGEGYVLDSGELQPEDPAIALMTAELQKMVALEEEKE